MKWKILLNTILVFAFAIGAESGYTAPTGSLHGTVQDRQTLEAIPGVTVLVIDAKTGAKADTDGKFSIADIPVGVWSVRISAIGYETMIRSDLQISAGRNAFLAVQLEPKAQQAAEMTVVADQFQQAPEMTTSSQRMSQEEIRRAPGGREDVTRALKIIPGVQSSVDERNDLIVRGGSPSEVLFRIDGIEFSNPTHFGTQGSSGGIFSMLNNDFIQDVNFLTGGFPARFGDKSSAVVDVAYREGSPKFTGNAYFGFGGAGFSMEGPLDAEKKGSYLFSVRRSYFDAVVKSMDYGAVPTLADLQFKIAYALTPLDRLVVLGIGGTSRIHYEQKMSNTKEPGTDMIESGNESGVAGISLTHLIPKLGFTRIIVSHDRGRYTNRIDTVESIANPVYHRSFYNNSQESQTELRNEWNLRLNEKVEWNSGIQFKRLYDHLNYEQFERTVSEAVPPLPDVVSYRSTDRIDWSNKMGVYSAFTLQPRLEWVVNIGGRFDYFQATKQQEFSPRLSLSYRPTGHSRITASYGIFQQTPPLVLIGSNPENCKLQNIRAEHYVLGFEQIFDGSTKFSIETYHKQYTHVPTYRDEKQWVSLLSMGDEFEGMYSFDALVSKGTGRSDGIEVMVQKKAMQGFYGIVSGTYSRTFFTPFDGKERPSKFDNPLLFQIVGGWKPNAKHELSAKWTYASGAPYTPIDEVASARLNYEISDTSRINAVRQPPYHRLDVRYDYRTFFTGWNLVSWISLENVYDRQNLQAKLWNRKNGKLENKYQMGILPVFGVTVEW